MCYPFNIYMGLPLKYLDISPIITEKLAVFPGDVPFSRDISMDFDKGDSLGLSSIQTTLHIGAHVDAPNHYHSDGCSIAERNLSFYLGRCQVVELNLKKGERIKASDLLPFEILAPRVLFKTNSFPNPNSWNSDFNSLSKEAIEFLHKKNVVLVGIDTPSIDPAEDKVLESHNSVYKNNMAVLEGIVLTKVKPGIYTLIALPLKIGGGDASPVRAILVEEKESIHDR